MRVHVAAEIRGLLCSQVVPAHWRRRALEVSLIVVWDCRILLYFYKRKRNTGNHWGTPMHVVVSQPASVTLSHTHNPTAAPDLLC